MSECAFRNKVCAWPKPFPKAVCFLLKDLSFVLSSLRKQLFDLVEMFRDF